LTFLPLTTAAFHIALDCSLSEHDIIFVYFIYFIILLFLLYFAFFDFLFYLVVVSGRSDSLSSSRCSFGWSLYASLSVLLL